VADSREPRRTHEPNVIVDLGSEPAAPMAPVPVPPMISPPITRPGTPLNVQRVTPTMPRVVTRPSSSVHMAAAKRRSGRWLVVLVYLMSATALGLSIYFRFVA